MLYPECLLSPHMHWGPERQFVTLVTYLSLPLPALVFLPLPHPSPTLPALILPSLQLLLPASFPSPSPSPFPLFPCLSLFFLFMYFCCYIYVSCMELLCIEYQPERDIYKKEQKGITTSTSETHKNDTHEHKTLRTPQNTTWEQDPGCPALRTGVVG